MKADFGIFGGDDRNKYLAAELGRRGYEVITYAMACSRKHESVMPVPDNFELAGTLAELVQSAAVLVGPVPFSRYVVSNDSIHSEEKELTEEMLLENLHEGQCLYAGGIPEGFLSRAQKKGAVCRDFLKDDLFLQDNAWMTAEGCMAELLAAWPGCIKGSRILITGCGSCGRAIAQLLKQAGAEVTVCVRSVSSAWKAHEEGCAVSYFESLDEKLTEQDIIINTVPALVLKEAQLQKVRPDALLVEIASAPGGFLREAVNQAGLTAIWCPGLPGRYSPYGAAKAMANCLERK